MTEGVDYAWDRPTASGLAAAGKRFAVRYGGPGSAGKQLDAAELARLLDAGLAVVANAEGTANGLLGGRTAGAAWARSAEQHFRDLGMPGSRPIYLSVDFDAGAADWSAIDAALRGAAEVLGPARVGVYGSYDTIAHCKAAGTARWFWQTYAWSGGRWHPAAHLRQYRNHVSLAGGTVDLCRAMVADYGQWGQTESVIEEDTLTPAEFVTILRDPTVAALMRALPWQYEGGGIPAGMSALGCLNELVVRDRAAGDDPAEIAAGILAAFPLDQLAATIVDKLPAADARRLLDEMAARLAT